MNHSNAVMALLAYIETTRDDARSIVDPHHAGRHRPTHTAMDLIAETRDGLLLVTASGELTFNGALKICQTMCDLAAGLGLTKILFDCLAVEGDLSREERFDLGKTIAEYCNKRLRIPTVALIGKPPSVTGYGAAVASNRGMPVETFSNRQVGLDWLTSRP
jgi:hypothetical protein